MPVRVERNKEVRDKLMKRVPSLKGLWKEEGHRSARVVAVKKKEESRPVKHCFISLAK